jgi:hypothetical protein
MVCAKRSEIMRVSSWLIGAVTLVSANSAHCDPFFAYNAADFVVPVDELDAAAIGEAAVHSGFRPLSESDAKLRALRGAADPAYEVWDLPSHKIATITLTKLSKSNTFVVLFVSKEPSKHGASLSGEACKKWLSFSAALRSEFNRQQSKFRFRNPQCTP